MQTIFEAQTSLVILLQPVVRQNTETDEECIMEMFSQAGMKLDDVGYHVK